MAVNSVFRAVKEAQDAGLTLPLLSVLIAVAESPGLSITELADQLDVPQQTASRYVSILEGRYQQAGQPATFANDPLLISEAVDGDSRRRALHLSKNGAKTLDSFLRNVGRK